MVVELMQAGWDQIATRAFNRKVLMVGVAAGGDTAVALASVARIVIAYPACGHNVIEDRDRSSSIQARAADTGTGSSLIVRTTPWETSGYGYCFKSFDLAVIDPAAYPTPALDMLISEIAAYARTIVVIEPAGANLFDTVVAGLECLDYEVSAQGSVITATPKTGEPIVRAE